MPRSFILLDHAKAIKEQWPSLMARNAKDARGFLIQLQDALDGLASNEKFTPTKDDPNFFKQEKNLQKITELKDFLSDKAKEYGYDLSDIKQGAAKLQEDRRTQEREEMEEREKLAKETAEKASPTNNSYQHILQETYQLYSRFTDLPSTGNYLSQMEFIKRTL